MKLINSKNGYSIGVYNCENKDKTKVYKMMRDKRIKYFVPADYTENSKLDKLVKIIIDRTVENEKLEEMYYKNNKEVIDSYNNKNPENIKKEHLISSLENSSNFAQTHTIISKLNKIDNWTNEQIKNYVVLL